MDNNQNPPENNGVHGNQNPYEVAPNQTVQEGQTGQPQNNNSGIAAPPYNPSAFVAPPAGFVPFAPPTEHIELPPRKPSVLGRLWSLAYPVLFLFGIQFVIVIAYQFVIGFVLGIEYAMTGDPMPDPIELADIILQRYTDDMSLILLVSFAITGFVALIFYRRDIKKYKYPLDKLTEPRVPMWLAIIGLTLGAWVIGQILTTALMELIPPSEEVLDMLQTPMSGPIFLQILAVGIVGPICEELLFRGMIFKRLRNWIGGSRENMVRLWVSIIISSVIFGIAHANIYQFLYGFLMGIVCALVFVKFGTIFAPMLVHIVANIASVLSVYIPEDTSMELLLSIGGVLLLSMGAVMILVKPYGKQTLQND
ncbi:MAG: CPBP family intramembrane metalloprotease [Ruminococcus sp.]|jgi:membrane protease YdiL (CAAX protease family)|nr:CPBP family intramembrane metalloprotease [Ruminococcus sp.]